MSPRWRYFLPGYLLALPNTLVGVLLCLVLYRAKSWTWSGGCLECIGGDRILGKPGAQTWGWLIVYRDEKARARTQLRRHERVHVVQGFLGGPLFMLVYGMFFLRYYLTTQDDELPGWVDDYRRNPFERQAYRLELQEGGWA